MPSASTGRAGFPRGPGRPTAAVSTVVGAFDLDAAEARGALRRLHDLGLVNRGASADDYFAVDPRNALRAVVLPDGITYRGFGAG